MKRAALLVVFVVLAGCAGGTLTAHPRTTTTLHHVGCVEGVRPDPRCTPGTTNPQVTQATIHSTICVRGWTATVRPPVSVTDRIKTERMKAYGVGSQSKTLFELDHLIALELGGGTADVGNLWPEAYAGAQGARTKDRVENLVKARVCAGTLTLAEAQREITTDWTAVR